MKKTTLIAMAVSGILLGLLPESAQARRGWHRQSTHAQTPAAALLPVVDAELLPAEVTDLQFMREEEKLARDVYLAMYQQYGTRVFRSIARAEQRHMDAILNVLTTYGLEDPALEEAGKFANAELQELYDRLVETGMQSESDALMAGALVEEVDIEDLVAAMGRTTNSLLLGVYGNLLDGSNNHLRAFVRNLEALTGETYTAQHLSQEEVEAILVQDQVRGRRRQNHVGDQSGAQNGSRRSGSRSRRSRNTRQDWRSW